MHLCMLSQALTDPKVGVIKNLDEVSAIGHRVAQGGSKFRKSVLVNDEVIQGIRSLIPLAPLHNGPELDGILACEKVFGEDVPEVVVFDTSFLPPWPPKAYMYASPMSTMRNTVSAGTVSTEPPTGMSAVIARI